MRRQWLGVVVTLGALASAGASPALAQVDQVVVRVPFSFVVGHVTLPSGTYRIVAGSANLNMIVVTNVNGRGEANILTDWARPFSTDSGSMLVFRQIDEKYYLSAIRIPGEDTREVVLPDVPEPVLPHHGS